MPQIIRPAQPVDWRKLIQDLRDKGLKWRQIADSCGVGPSTLHDLWKGRTSDPTVPVRAKLKRLHTFTMNKARQS
jgi:transcriptional regulator with XRE-family HTH domain